MKLVVGTSAKQALEQLIRCPACNSTDTESSHAISFDKDNLPVMMSFTCRNCDKRFIYDMVNNRCNVLATKFLRNV